MTNKLVFILDHLGLSLPEEGRPSLVEEDRGKERSTWSLIYILDHLGFSLPDEFSLPEEEVTEAVTEPARKTA